MGCGRVIPPPGTGEFPIFALQCSPMFPPPGLLLFCSGDLELSDTEVLLALILQLPPGAVEASSSPWTNVSSLLGGRWTSPSTEQLLFARTKAKFLPHTVSVNLQASPARVVLMPHFQMGG